MDTARSGVFVGLSSIGSRERRRFSWLRSKPFRDTHGDQANILMAKAFHFPSESEGLEGGFVQIFRENHGAEFTEGETQLFRSKFPMCTSQLASKFVT